MLFVSCWLFSPIGVVRAVGFSVTRWLGICLSIEKSLRAAYHSFHWILETLCGLNDSFETAYIGARCTICVPLSNSRLEFVLNVNKITHHFQCSFKCNEIQFADVRWKNIILASCTLVAFWINRKIYGNIMNGNAIHIQKWNC